MLQKVINRTFVYWLAALIILLDQSSKHVVRTNVPLNTAWNLADWLAPYVRVLHIQNTGAAFGSFQNLGPVFAGVAVVVSIIIMVYAQRLGPGQWGMRVALGMQLGGALGNLIDRALFNFAVTDFVSVGSFAIFNVADASISLGVALLVVLMLLEGRQAPAPAGVAETPVPSEKA